MNDLVNLAKFNIYIKLMIDGVTSEPFSAETVNLYDKPATNFRDEIIELTRKNFSTPRSDVEAEIASWTGLAEMMSLQKPVGAPAVTATTAPKTPTPTAVSPAKPSLSNTTPVTKPLVTA